MTFAQWIRLRLAQYSTGHALWLWYERSAMAESESPALTVYQDGWPEPACCCAACSVCAVCLIAESSCADNGSSRLAVSATTA
jgi:hypothetical protein